MILDYSMPFEQETSDHQIHQLDEKLESRQQEPSNLSTYGSFSQPNSEHACDLTTSPMLSNQDEAEDNHECQISIDLDQQVAEVTLKMSSILQEIVKYQNCLNKKKITERKSTSFCNSCIPVILLNEYLNKIMNEAKLELDICILALFYVDRLIGCQPRFSINEYNCHRLILTSLMIASKMHLDIQPYHYPVLLFSKIGGVSERELFIMESEFLNLLNYKLFIDEEDYAKIELNSPDEVVIQFRNRKHLAQKKKESVKEIERKHLFSSAAEQERDMKKQMIKRRDSDEGVNKLQNHKLLNKLQLWFQFSILL